MTAFSVHVHRKVLELSTRTATLAPTSKTCITKIMLIRFENNSLRKQNQLRREVSNCRGCDGVHMRVGILIVTKLGNVLRVRNCLLVNTD